MTNRTEVSFEDFPVTGSMTGTFLGSDVEDVSFIGSASWADTSRTASIAETASLLTGFVESASFAATASIVLGGIESATFAVTAAFTETASIATTAETASLAETASFAVLAETASFASTAETASFAESAETASFATTASFAELAETASFAATASIAAAALSAPLLIPIPSFLDQLKLNNIKAPIDIILGAESQFQLNLTNHPFSRISIAVTIPDDNGGRPRVAIQYSLNQTDWFFLDGADGPYADITGSPGLNIRVAGPVVAHVSESKTDVFLRAITYSGSVSAPFESPVCFGMFWFLQIIEGQF